MYSQIRLIRAKVLYANCGPVKDVGNVQYHDQYARCGHPVVLNTNEYEIDPYLNRKKKFNQASAECSQQMQRHGHDSSSVREIKAPGTLGPPAMGSRNPISNPFKLIASICLPKKWQLPSLKMKELVIDSKCTEGIKKIWLRILLTYFEPMEVDEQEYLWQRKRRVNEHTTFSLDLASHSFLREESRKNECKEDRIGKKKRKIRIQSDTYH